ncbi:energy-coupling factor ABC transporter ATP-binding protein [Pseudalkalibacillus salsuginis]|uniref:energy-coupling factor ABC transporter ATP-binding protein n=1 Tax=Pseudalkalibacillus salsuginis TaxID=2910972 RepID=UPI001F46A0CF|nr:energy-coupling factor ABC transporter ATP-binding protein [Pseudalkalibacillus salsuginis]MCF6411825.1 energy-coupling factor ABC transporter ATP-binding protein [Pseudalkalibacillus salsuginis]
MKGLIIVHDVSFRYEDEGPYRLANINLTVPKGEWLSIVGHNGSGKSTLAKLLNGLLLPDEGTVRIGGKRTDQERHLWDIRKQVGMVFQNPDNQFVGTTVKDDIAFGLENNGVPREEMIERISDSLTRVQMTEYENQEPHQLSGGQKQRVAIAGVLAQKPDVIVLDEATSMLDPIGRKEVLQTIRELNEQDGITVLSITHDLEEAIKADRMIVMKQGKMVASGAPKDVFQNTDLLLAAGLELPFSLTIQKKLKEKGIHLPAPTLTQSELVDALWNYQLNA